MARSGGFDAVVSSLENPHLERQTQAMDRLVYELYGLTEEEIKIVEEATSLRP